MGAVYVISIAPRAAAASAIKLAYTAGVFYMATCVSVLVTPIHVRSSALE